MKRKGFTLVELLAVIVVLAIIALIAVPSILGVIDKAKKGALKDSAYGLVDAATLYYAQYGEGARFDFDDNGNVTSNTNNKLSYKGKVENGTLLVNSKGKIMICINDGENVAYKNYSDTSVVVVTGKTCNVNVSETQVLLDGENTINEYTNQELTDLVDSLQQQINAQNEKIALLEENTTNTDFETRVITFDTTDAVKLYVTGNVVNLRTGSSAISINALTSVTIPEEYRPSETVVQIIDYIGYIGRIIIKTDGTISTNYRTSYGSTSTSNMNGSYTINFNMNWVI